MAEPTVLDALVAEMLGDIGKLHDAVNSLKTTLPEQTEAVETKITGLIGLLQQAGDIYKEQITAYTNAAGKEVQVLAEKDFLARKALLDSAVSEALKGASRSFESTVQTEISKLRSAQPRFANLLLSWLVCGLIGGVVVILGNYVIYGKTRTEATALGDSVGAAWNKLDPKVRAAISTEREPRNNSK